MRIAIFSDNFYPELSGISDSIILTATELANRGHFINFYVPRYSSKDYQILNLPPQEIDLGGKVKITRFSSLPYPSGTSQGRATIPTCLRWLKVRHFNPDIIHVHLPFGIGIEGVVAAKILNKPLVGTNHTPISEFVRYSPIQGRWIKNLINRYNTWFYNRCDFISSPCEAIFGDMPALNINIPHRAIPNPINLKTFQPLPNKKSLKKKFGFPDFSLLYVGRLAPEKNIDLIVKALPLIHKEFPKTTFGIVGRGSAENKLRRKVISCHLEDKVKFLGFIKDINKLAEVYNASEVFVMMSTAETQSIAAMQAMSCGLPVVGVRAWGLKEYINPKNGILINPMRIDELAQSIIYLFKNPNLRKKMGQGGQNFTKRFYPPKIAEVWEQIYEKVIKDYNK